MADKAMDVYLSDHLAGAMFGSNLAEQIRDRNEGTALGHVMRSLADEIKADQQTLSELMDRIGTAKNPVKQASTWIAEKATRAKFRGHLSGEAEVGTFMALETLALGVEGKASLWRTLKAVSPEYPELASVDLTGLINRAEAQRSTLEDERLSRRHAGPGGSRCDVTTAARRAGQRQHPVSADCGLRGNTFADAVSWVLIDVDAADQN